MISLLIWLILVLLVAGAVLGLVKAILALPLFANVQPYANVIYALVVLLVVLYVVDGFYHGGLGVFDAPFRGGRPLR